MVWLCRAPHWREYGTAQAGGSIRRTICYDLCGRCAQRVVEPRAVEVLNMAKNGFKVFDSDMHIVEPTDLWEQTPPRPPGSSALLVMRPALAY
jgi:hypothetical protein